jgi:hypothetical protein
MKRGRRGATGFRARRWADEGKRAGAAGWRVPMGEKTRRTAAESGRVRGRRPDHRVPGARARPGGAGQR